KIVSTCQTKHHNASPQEFYRENNAHQYRSLIVAVIVCLAVTASAALASSGYEEQGTGAAPGIGADRPSVFTNASMNCRRVSELIFVFSRQWGSPEHPRLGCIGRFGITQRQG